MEVPSQTRLIEEFISRGSAAQRPIRATAARREDTFFLLLKK